MTARVSADSLRLSVVLATDKYETIRPVLSALRRQASAREIEPIIVLLGGDATTVPLEDLSAFPHAKVVRSVNHLPEARAAGVRAASAPIVFIGETHTYPESGWAEALLTAFDGPWAAVIPAIGNANPARAASWASYLFDYGTWGPNRHSGEIADPLIYNTAYRREVLLSLDDGLPAELDPSEESLWPLLMSRGHRSAFASDARILHLNVGTFKTLIREKFCVGVVLGTHRSSRWSHLYRLLYFVASPLIPIVLFGRVLRGARHWPSDSFPTSAILGVLIAALAKTAGEIVGYAGVKLPAAAARLQDIEVHKVQYAGRVG
jgi:hypothetical protein